MDIQSAQQDGFGAFVVTTVQGATLVVPDDPNNVDRKALQTWVAAGNKIAPVKAPPAPAPNTTLDFSSFMTLLTVSEQAGLVASQDADVKLFLLMASAEGQVDASDPQTQKVLTNLTSLGVLTAARAKVITAGLTASS